MAFPTNSTVLDDFTRAGPAIGTNWSSPIYFGLGDTACTIQSNQIAPNTDVGNSPYSDALWVPNTFLNTEVYAQVTAKAAARALFARVNNANTATVDHVNLQESFGAPQTWGIYEQIAGATEVVIGATWTQAYAVNDWFGLEVLGSSNPITINAYYLANGGSWTLMATRSSTSHLTAGSIGISLEPGSGTANRMDNFSGGAQVVGPAPPLTMSYTFKPMKQVNR
jgi:hypothetical protein